MHRVLISFTSCSLLLSSVSIAQHKPSAPSPKTISVAQLKDAAQLDGQLVQLDSVIVRHTDTAQVFTFGDQQGPDMHVVIPNPAIDSPNIGDTLSVVGTVRRYNAKDFERDYKWFRQADYPDLESGKWVIVARSVRTPEGTDLVPGGTTSEAK